MSTKLSRRLTTRRHGWLALTVLAVLAVPLGAYGQEVRSPDRGGFTLMLNLGVGFQHDGYVDRMERGLAGLNLGIGGFLTDDVALLFRVSGTSAVDFGNYRQTSGVGAPVIQYWLNDRVALEVGAGLGFWSVRNTIAFGDLSDSGLGLIVGAGYTLLNAGKHSFRLGLEYAPAFTEPEMVHNVGLVIGWQML
jgi:hypothetical protein